MAKLIITFNEDFQEDYRLGYTYSSIDTGLGEYTGFMWKNVIDNTMQVLVASATGVVGEATAINFVDALENNMPTQQAQDIEVTRIDNVVTIKALLADYRFSNSFAYQCMYPCEDVALVDFVINDAVEVPEVPEIEVINPIVFSGINIDIIDTQQNELPLNLEFAEINAPKLVYNGADDRFQTLMSSQLEFNMLVPNAQDGQFLHLFDGSETRYKVQITDTAIVPKLIWQGYLLPEQFSEPYNNGCFFVNFLATDGIGRLKGKYLPEEYYKLEQTIPKIIASCLKLTGNVLIVYIAPAIKNAIASLKLKDIAINTISYIKTDKKKKPTKKDAYYILNEVVKSIGCKLLQYNGAWFIIGINRFKDTSISLEKYNYNGDYIGGAVMNRSIMNAVFEASPELSINSKLKKVEVDWEYNQKDTLTPDTLILQEFNIDNDQVDIKHWNEVGAIKTTAISTIVHSGDVTDPYNDEHFYMMLTDISRDGIEVMLSRFYPYTIPEYFNYAKIHAMSVDVFKFGLNGWVNNNANRYVEFIKPIYVDGDFAGKKTIKFQLEFDAYLFTTFTNVSDANPYKYELLLNGVVICENTNGSLGEIEYRFKESWSTAQLSGSVSIDKLPIYESGYLTFRFYAPMITENGGSAKSKKVIIKTLIIDLETVPEPLVKIRDIDFTTENKISVIHSDDRLNNSDAVFVVSKDYPFTNISENIPVVDIQINTLAWASPVIVYSGGGGGWAGRRTYFEISQADYEYLKQVDPSLIKLKVGGVLQEITFPYSLMKSYFNVFPLRFYFSTIQGGINLDPRFYAVDELWVHKDAYVNVIDDKQYLRDKWSRFEQTENIRYSEALVRIIHDARKDNRYKIAGYVFGIKFPFDILRFNYLGEKDFMLTRLSLNLSNGMTDVIAIEQAQDDVTDYISE